MQIKTRAENTLDNVLWINDNRMEEIHHQAESIKISDFQSIEEWNKRKKYLKNRIMLSAGLYPPREREKLKIECTNVIQFDEFKVKNIYFESLPGVCIAANLYIPHHSKRYKCPGILCPHGHWVNGRFERSELIDVPVRMANYARNGWIGLSFDMCGYGESFQFTPGDELLHRGFGEQAERYGVNLFGLQLINAITALDVLCMQPDVDTNAIGVTGASGGATQSFFLAALDERVTAVMPVNMLSDLFQGGCDCENAPFLRIGVSNWEYAAMVAPRPMCITGTSGDWTRHIRERVFPQIQKIYRLYNAEENLTCFFDNAPHNYNQKAREQSYRFFGKVFESLTVFEREKPFSCDIAALHALKNIDLETYLTGDALINHLIKMRKEEMERFAANLDVTMCEKLRELMYVMFHLDQLRPGCFVKEEEVEEKSIWRVEFQEYTLHCECFMGVGKGNALVLDYREKDSIKENKQALQALRQRFKCVIFPDIFGRGKAYAGKKRKKKPDQANEFYDKPYFNTYNDQDDVIRVQDIVALAEMTNWEIDEIIATEHEFCLLQFASVFFEKELPIHGFFQDNAPEQCEGLLYSFQQILLPKLLEKKNTVINEENNIRNLENMT